MLNILRDRTKVAALLTLTTSNASEVTVDKLFRICEIFGLQIPQTVVTALVDDVRSKPGPLGEALYNSNVAKLLIEQYLASKSEEQTFLQGEPSENPAFLCRHCGELNVIYQEDLIIN